MSRPATRAFDLGWKIPANPVDLVVSPHSSLTAEVFLYRLLLICTCACTQTLQYWMHRVYEHYNHKRFSLSASLNLWISQTIWTCTNAFWQYSSTVQRSYLRKLLLLVLVLSQVANALQAHCTAWVWNAWHLAVCHFYPREVLMDIEYECSVTWWPSKMAAISVWTACTLSPPLPPNTDLFISSQADHTIWTVCSVLELCVWWKKHFWVTSGKENGFYFCSQQN